MRRIAAACLLTALGVCAPSFAAQPGEIVSREAIEAALQKPPEVRTRGLKIQARSEESRGAIDLQVAFALNSAALLPEARGQLSELAGALKSPRLAGQRFELAGHTDASGRPERNRELSLARATAVRDYLAGQGVDAAALSVAGYGADRPLPDRSPQDALNRRVEIRTREAAP
jgi:OOP family OmpA-OmpF porin